jgi:GDP-L-fucose synthase
MDVVFNLVGIKASPKILAEKPASSFVPHLQFNTNTMEAAMKNNVEWYMYTSTVGVYETEDVEILTEDDVWLTFPSKNDWFGGWAKRMGELQAQAYEIEYKRKNISVVRPGNVYGRYDNFDPENAMVIPSLISKAVNSKDGYFSVWGDGKTQRDFIHARDVARGMLYCVEKEITEPINLGSGEAYTIKSIAEIIAELTNTKIKWDTTKPSGDSKRLLDMTRAKLYGFESEMTLRDGIEDVLNWYMENKEFTKSRYNTFEEIK